MGESVKLCHLNYSFQRVFINTCVFSKFYVPYLDEHWVGWVTGQNVYHMGQLP